MLEEVWSLPEGRAGFNLIHVIPTLYKVAVEGVSLRWVWWVMTLCLPSLFY